MKSFPPERFCSRGILPAYFWRPFACLAGAPSEFGLTPASFLCVPSRLFQLLFPDSLGLGIPCPTDCLQLSTELKAMSRPGTPLTDRLPALPGSGESKYARQDTSQLSSSRGNEAHTSWKVPAMQTIRASLRRRLRPSARVLKEPLGIFSDFYPFCASLAQASLRVMVRLKTGLPGALSLSSAK